MGNLIASYVQGNTKYYLKRYTGWYDRKYFILLVATDEHTMTFEVKEESITEVGEKPYLLANIFVNMAEQVVEKSRADHLERSIRVNEPVKFSTFVESGVRAQFDNYVSYA